jgi:hypothetical protein
LAQGFRCLTVNSREKVRNRLKQFVLVQLYVDVVPDKFYREAPADKESEADGESNYEFERKHFETMQVPLYVIVKPKAGDSFDVAAAYDEGKITDENAFVGFLDKPFQPAK